jgi:hypothetical protein
MGDRASTRLAGLAAFAAAASCAVFALTTLTLVPAASAAPTVIARGKAVPIPGFPHTGNFFGAGAAVKAEVLISGTEYGGFPPPLIGITVFLPTGVHLHPQGFPICPKQTILEEREPRRCPRGSAAGPPGRAEGVVAFGGERVKETVEIFSFFGPNGSFEFLTEGHSPVSLEIPSSARLLQPGGGGGFGPEFTGEIPLVSTVPGAPYASVESIKITLGAAIRKHGKAIYYGTVPKRCPRGGFRVKSEFTFAENGDTSTPVTVVVPFRAPCPKH